MDVTLVADLNGDLQTRLRTQALALGAAYFGVADLLPVRGFVTAQGGDFLAEYRFGVSTGIALSDAVVDQLYQHVNRDIARIYHHHIYTAVAAMLVYEQSLVRADDLSQVKRAFDLNGYVGILYLLVLAVSLYGPWQH